MKKKYLTKPNDGTTEFIVDGEKFKNAFDHSLVGMALVSTQGRWVYVNHALCHMLGFSRQELLSKDFADITYPDETDRDIAAMKKMLSGEMDIYEIEKRYITKRGQTIWVLLHVTLIRNSSHEPLYFVTDVDNIDRLKKTENAMQLEQETLQKVNKLMTGRELKMIELKEEIQRLRQQL